jgi:zinc transport system substrate-binding protein
VNRRTSPLTSLLVPALLVPLLAACADQGAAAASGTQVVVGAYPMQFVAERVGGEHVTVTNLTPPGAEPHDLELTPRDVATVSEADLVLTLPGLQPALDAAASAEALEASMDLTGPARVVLVSQDEGHAGHGDADEADPQEGHEDGEHEDGEHEDGEHEGGGHGDGEHDDEGGHAGHGTIDPHFWLDPTRLADAADAVAARLGELDPEHAEEFTADAADLRADLEQLDGEFAASLQACDNHHLVTSHAAFGYLAERYGLHQMSVSGLSPDTEPNPGTLADIATAVRDEGVTTVFTETLVSPDTAKAVAAEAGATTAVLDPLEGLAEDADGDYLSVMRENLSVLEEGLGCS